MRQYFNSQGDKNDKAKGLYVLLAVFVWFTSAMPVPVQAQLAYTVNDIDSLERRFNTPSLTDIEIYETCQALVSAHIHTDREKSLAYIQKGLLLAEKFNNYFYFCELYFNAGMVHYNLNHLDSARYYYEKALAMHPLAVKQGLASQTDLDYFLVRTLVSFATLYYPAGQYDLMLDYYYQALEMAEKVNLPADAAFINQIIAESNIGLKNSAKTIEYFHKTIETKNMYANQNFQASISEMEVKYETEKKEVQIAALNKEKRLLKRQSIAVGVVLLLGLASLFFLWRWTMQKRRLAEQQHAIAEQRRELAETYIRQLEQEKQLVATQAVFDGEVQERTRLARDLHDGMGGNLTAMKIRLQELKQNTGIDVIQKEQFNIVMAILDDSIQEMRRVSHNLMPDTLSRAGLKPAVDDFCRSMSPLIVFNYYGHETRLDLKLEALIYRCIHELVNNALKYAAASQIMVQIIQEADRIAFTVQDDGCGFDPTAGTGGIGLKNVRSRVASVGGDIQIDSKEGVGTEINVELRM